MVKAKIIIIAAVIFLFGLFLNYILGWLLGIQIEFLGSVYGYILILAVSIPLAISAFLPYTWGKVLREISYFCLFILILLVEINLVKPFLKRTEIDLIDCEKSIFPKGESEGFVYDALKYTSCVLSGKFPTEAGNVGWAVFYIFYLILPFAFIFAFIYGLINSLDLRTFFGNNENIPKIFAFIIAIYAARTMMGGFLLQFAGYGAWGLAAVFLAVFFVKGLQKIIENWFGIEQAAQETKKIIESEIEWQRKYALVAEPIFKRVKELGRDKRTLAAAKAMLATIKNNEIWNSLDSVSQTAIEWYLDKAKTAATPETFMYYVNELEVLLKKMKK